MVTIKKIICLLLPALVIFGGCEYVESPDDTAEVREGFITYPALNLVGDEYMSIPVGESFVDPGFSASLGVDDITDQVVVSGTVDSETSGFYPITYSIDIVNELGDANTIVSTRIVLVYEPDVAAIDLSGQYQGAGFGTDIVTVNAVTTGVYEVDKALASGNNIAITFVHSGGTNIAVPDQPHAFGNINTSADGTSASLSEDGRHFEWSIFIGCCGVFGPITFDKI